MKPKDLPIGYWIKKADQLLTNGVNQIQAGFGLTRTSWQVLNTIKENNEITKSELFELMQPFADKPAVETILMNFSQNRILEEDGARIWLTAKGAEMHSNCLARQQNFRQRCMKDISENEYQTTLLTLKKMVTNLEELK